MKEILKKVRQIEINTRRVVTDVFAGQYHSVFKGRGMEFHEVREYIPGDDVRMIDWNVTARVGTPFVKKFVEERELTVMLLVDISASNTFGHTAQLKKDLAAELAAVLAFAAIKNNDRVGLILFSDQIECFVPPQKGTRHVLRVIREALYFQPKSRGTKISPALDFLNHVATHRAVAFLISDFFFNHENYARLLAVTAKRHDLVGVVVGDRLERDIPPVGVVEWIDAETGGRLLVDTAAAHTRTGLAIAAERRHKDLLHKLRSAGLDTMEVFAGEDYEKALIKFFRWRERKKNG